jgi:hypothetical protein
MSTTPSVGAFAIVPSNNLTAAIPFWERLGFARTGGVSNYVIFTGWGCEVHLTQAGTGLWRVPEENNPFGVFIRTPDVATIASRVEGLQSTAELAAFYGPQNNVPAFNEIRAPGNVGNLYLAGYLTT